MPRKSSILNLAEVKPPADPVEPQPPAHVVDNPQVDEVLAAPESELAIEVVPASAKFRLPIEVFPEGVYLARVSAADIESIKAVVQELASGAADSLRQRQRIAATALELLDSLLN